MKWTIENEQISTTVWEVEADSREEALQLFQLGEAEQIDSYDDEFIDVSLAEDE